MRSTNWARAAKALILAALSGRASILAPSARPLEIEDKKPFVILVVGVNGSGKTTTIGKLARRYKADGLNVMLAAGDSSACAGTPRTAACSTTNIQ